MRTLLILLIIGSLCSCGQPTPAESDTASSAKAPAGPAQFQTAVADLRLRETAGEKGVIVAVLPKGAVLEDLGEVSDFTTRVTLRGIHYDEPWIKVKTAAGQVGWVYAGGLNFDPGQNSKTADVLLQKRAASIFGEAYVKRLRAHQRDFAGIRTEQDFARALQESAGLRDTLVRILEKRIQPGSAEELPDLFWAGALFTGYQPQVVAEGTAYYFFCDYRQWAAPARRTTGPQDDLFLDLQFTAFPEDSIEYFFPGWTIQTWDYGGSSLLGKGVHKAVLDKINAQSAPGGLFESLLLKMKEQVIGDITAAEASFWYSPEEALKELDGIIAAKYKVLTQQDVVALSTRRQQLEDPKKHGLVVNARKGN